jgi:hypothetical protein
MNMGYLTILLVNKLAISRDGYLYAGTDWAGIFRTINKINVNK